LTRGQGLGVAAKKGLIRIRTSGAWMVRAGLHGKDHMSKCNDNSKLDRAKPENRVLADSELAAVTGGRIPTQHPAKVTIPDLKL
jgi:hypothetical protein